jgi:hypothetical protein
MQMDSLTHTTGRLEHAVRNLSPGLARRYCAIDSFREHDGLGKWCLALPPKLSVLICANLDSLAQLGSELSIAIPHTTLVRPPIS